MKPFSEICTKCGECCRHVGNSKLFPLPTNPDGSCIMLKDGKCTIYEDRPLICRVDDLYNEGYINKKYSYKEYIKANIDVCNTLIEMAKLDSKYIIDFENI